MTKIKRVLGIHVIGGFLWYLYVPKGKETYATHDVFFMRVFHAWFSFHKAS